VVQMVFANLARRAASLSRQRVLMAWLHRDTRFTALDLLRSEGRRIRREERAMRQGEIDREPDPDWQQLRPVIDETLDRLGREDRHAVLLRFMEGRDLAGVGAALGLSSEAARKRVDRALERLRHELARRGIESSAAALGTVLSAHAIEGVPSGLAASVIPASVAAAGVAGGVGVGAWWSTLGWLGQGKAGIGVALALAGLGMAWIVQESALRTARAEHMRWVERAAALAPQVDPPASEGPLHVDSRAERMDLDRLRHEVPALRARLRELQALEARTAQNGSGTGKSSPPSEGMFWLSEVREVGQATPEALFESHLAALQRGDTNRLAQLAWFDPDTDPERIRGKFESIRRVRDQEVDESSESARLAAIRVLRCEAASDHDLWVVHEYVMKDGTAEQLTRVRVRRVEGGWRLVMGPDVQPVMEFVREMP
jgi:RNA polymerase sigma factor (sigma-70 family)